MLAETTGHRPRPLVVITSYSIHYTKLYETSNVLYFDLSDDAWVCVRPSGTEPKIKFYVGVTGNSFENSDEKMKELKSNLLALA